MKDKMKTWHASQGYHVSLSAPQHIDSCEKELKVDLRESFTSFQPHQTLDIPALQQLRNWPFTQLFRTFKSDLFGNAD